MKKLMIVVLAACCGCLVQNGAKELRVKYVDEFDLSHAVSGYGKKTAAKMSAAGTPLTMRGQVYARGFGDHPESVLAFSANGKVAAFDAVLGLDDASKEAAKGSYGWPVGEFKIWADGLVVWRSGFMGVDSAPLKAHVDLTGAKEIILESTTGREWTSCNAVFADWADARFSLEDGATLEPIVDPARTAQLGILTPPEKPTPQFNGADIWGVRPGHPVIFRVPVSGEKPIRFTAKNLPDGVTLDERGVLRGTAPAQPGIHDIEITAENAKGKATRTIRLSVGDMIALTPPMGWNSWNVWCYRLTQDYAMASAKAMEDSGLGDHGWAYINLDDFWEMNNSNSKNVEKRKCDFNGREDLIGPARDAEGKILPNRSFPDMKKLTDYIHSFGFKAGLYSSPGPLTCGRCEGSYGHELQDATSWAEWGFDYIKYDWCTYRKIFEDENKDWKGNIMLERCPGLEKPYALMGACLKKQNRDIVYSFCQYGMGRTQEWGNKVGGNCWRSWGDLKDAWVWMERAIEGRHGADRVYSYNRPGWWADPDMMIVGGQYSFGSDHPSYLTPNEQYTHVSLWAILGSPLLIGCDLTKLDAFTRNLLVNDEVIAISQDRLGRAPRRIRHADGESVWIRPLVGGDIAVALVNRAPLSHEIRVTFDELRIQGARYVLDCWTGKCEGKHGGFYAATVQPHATKLIRIKAHDCPKCD